MRFFLVILLYSFNIYADQVKLEVSPEKPVYGESFEVTFKIQTDQDDEPVINFDTVGIDVLGRSNTSTSTRITYINGESSVERTMSVVYEMSAPRPGGVFLRDIKVEVGGKKLSHPTFKINVLRETRRPKDVFVQVEVNKESIFMGEGLIARYYLYHLNSVSLASSDIERFPKLDKFLKRFQQENLPAERVSINGQVYIRRIMYTAQLFGNKVGKFKIDPIRLKVRYGRGGNSLSAFGFNFSNSRVRTTRISSKPIEIEVMTLPSKGMPPHFTGLVGNHSFSLSKSKDRFISNEPIELQLTVRGDGALELFEAPTLLSDPNLEEFEKSNDFQVMKGFKAEKKINYTYLGRGSVDIENKEVPISYFDPESKEYITEILKIGNVKVASTGGTSIGKSEKPSQNISKSENCPPGQIDDPSSKLDEFSFLPLKKPLNTYMYHTKELFYFFALIILCLLGYLVFKLLSGLKLREMSTMERIFKSGVSYGALHDMLNADGKYNSMDEAIHDLSISKDCKSYFESLIKTLNLFFSSNNEDHKVVVNKKYFKELSAAIKESKSGDHN